MMFNIKMCKILIEGRRAKGYTQEDAAEIAEVSVETIRNMEHGIKKTRFETIVILCDAYELPPDSLMKFYIREQTTDEIIKRIDKKHEQKKAHRG